MKKSVLLFFTVLTHFLFAQNVVLNKVAKTSDNQDKFLYKINPDNNSAEYLGELEVQGFSDDNVKVFGMIYKKAKEIGANAFAWKPFETIDGASQKFDQGNYKLSLFYIKPENLPVENNVIYLISSPFKKQTISVNGKNVVFAPRTFRKIQLNSGEVTTISTRKLLGSSINLSARENQPVQYFQLSAFSVNNNAYGTAGINFKSGDITKLERSYGEFLTTVYQFTE